MGDNMININKDKQITKFKYYGFLKNLKFYEPFIIIYLLSFELSLYQIGLLYSLREAIIYIFEVPSGVFADRYGRKLELIICFLFYIGSFLFFFIGTDFYMFIIAMGFYGFGEALRTGTHKAIIMQYLEVNQVKESKGKVYGLTRSYSMLGSSLSSLLAIIFLFFIKDLRYFFLLAIIPYLADMILIMTYPSYLNNKSSDYFSVKDMICDGKNSIKYSFSSKKRVKLIFSSSLYNSIFKTVKDYLQPIIIFSSISLLSISGYTQDENAIITVAIIYMIIYFISSIASKQSSYVGDKFGKVRFSNISFLLFAVVLITLSFFLKNIYIVGIGFILLYIITNLRRPIMVELVGNEIENKYRASVLSIESQLTSIITIVIAPIFGYIAQEFSISRLFIGLGLALLLCFTIFLRMKKRVELKRA